MNNIITITQAVAIISACWAIISGVGAWKREFIGKRRIELAEQVLEKFFEIKDAIAFIRHPASSTEEGSTRQKSDYESAEDTQLLNRGYIVVERYAKKEQAFVDFKVLKYKFMASFGTDTEAIFTETNKILNSIFISAQMLSTYYWKRQGRVPMEGDEFQKHLDEMYRHEGIFWSNFSENDEIEQKLQAVQKNLEEITAPCFREPMQSYSLLTKEWWVHDFFAKLKNITQCKK